MKTTVIKKLKQLALLAVLLISTQACMVTSIHPLYSEDVKAHLEGLAGTWGGSDNQIIITPVHDLQLQINGKNVGLFSSKTIPTVTVKDKKGNEKTVKTKDCKLITSYKDSFYRITYISTKEEKETTKNLRQVDTVINNTRIIGAMETKKFHLKDTAQFTGKLLKLKDQYYMDVVLDDDFLEKKIPNISMQAALLSVHLFCKVILTKDKLNLVFLEEDNLNRFIKKSNVKLNFIKSKGRFILTSETSRIM